MPTIDEIRRLNLDRLADETGGNLALANLVGVTESQMTQWRKGSKNSGTGKARGMRLASCHRIEGATKKPRGWLDTFQDASSAATTATARPNATPPTTLAQALPVLLGRLAGLNDYTAGMVLAALQAATRSHAPPEEIERDLLQWLGERAASDTPTAAPEKRQANG